MTTKVIENPTPSEYDRYRGGDSRSEHGHKIERITEHESVHKSDSHGSETERETEQVYIRKREPSRRRHRSRSRARGRVEEVEEEDTSGAIGGPLTLLTPRRGKSRGQRDIQAEIRSLESEKRSLRLEREGVREGGRDEPQYEFVRPHKHREREREREEETVVEEKKERDVVRVEKDRRGRLSLVKSSG